MSFHPIIKPEDRHRSQRTLSEDGAPFEFTPEHRAELEELCTHYPPERRKSAVIYALFVVQRQQRYITRQSMRAVAEFIGCTPAEVEDVVTFYTMFYRKPVGTHILQVCRTLSCALGGAERLTEALSEKLGIQPGETDAAGEFTLMEVECLGACDRAPVLMVNDEHWHEHADPARVDDLIAQIRAKGAGAFTGCHLGVPTRS